MEQKDFLQKEEIRTPEKEIDVRLVLAENTSLKSEVTSLKEENAELKEQVAWFKKTLYGSKSEKTEKVMEVSEQLSMFDEVESEAEVTPQSVKTTEVKSHKRKAKRKHDEIFGDLEVEEVVHKVEETECELCGAEMKVIGKKEVRVELVYVPARLFLRRHMAETAICTECGDPAHDYHPDIEPYHLVQAKAPAAMMPHSFCSPELLAHIIFEKYCQAVPLYRQEKSFEAMGVRLSRTTMANWVIAASALWLKPVWNEMKKQLLESNVIHADETVVQVLNEPGRKATTDSRMWVYANGKVGDRSIIMFDYRPTRSGNNALDFLGDYDGYLVCDGFDGYNKLKSATRCGCFAHVRRKFVDALPSDKSLLPTSQAAKGVEFCNKLFELEREFAELTSEERHLQRQERSKPLLDELFTWLEGLAVAGGTKLAKAVQYAKSQKKYLYRFLENGDVPIDNNRAENAIRPFCVGRKNWLFSASVKGAEASAMLYSVAATACANGMNVEEYLTELFRSKPGTVLLPW